MSELTSIKNKNDLIIIQNSHLNSFLTKITKAPYYRDQFKKIKLPSNLSIENIHELPFTSKNDLKEAYPDKLFAVDKAEIVRYHATSGTTSTPVLAAYTEKDISNWASLTQRVLQAGGVTRQDVVQISFGYGLFTGGLGFHYGAEKLGAAVVPTAIGNTERQIKLMMDLGTTTLLCTPSYANYLSEIICGDNQIKGKLNLNKIFCGGERWSEPLRTALQNSLGVRAYDNYGLTELCGPGVAFEDQEQDGLYISEDHFYPEIIDPDSGKIINTGEEGELVLTSFQKEGMPLLRYRTGDITRFIPHNSIIPFRKIARIKARTDDMIILKGVNFYPKQIEDLISAFPELSSQYEIHLSSKNNKEHLKIRIESFKQSLEIGNKLSSKCQNLIGLKPEIELLVTGSLERKEGKTKRVFDLRAI